MKFVSEIFKLVWREIVSVIASVYVMCSEICEFIR